MIDQATKAVIKPPYFICHYLTENIYVVNQEGVFRFHNRNPGSDLTTRDHRLELIRAGDVRDGLRSGICLMHRVMLYSAWMLGMWIGGMRVLRRGLWEVICCCRGLRWVWDAVLRRS